MVQGSNVANELSCANRKIRAGAFEGRDRSHEPFGNGRPRSKSVKQGLAETNPDTLSPKAALGLIYRLKGLGG